MSEIKQVSQVRKWMSEEFERVWNQAKETPRGKIIKFTRKYVAKIFFYEGMNAILDYRKKLR